LFSNPSPASLENGRLRGFYYRTFANFAMDATSAASVADGGWHHAAMTVDASGGKLFLDGTQVGSGTWASTPSAPTNSEPVLIGGYTPSLYSERFHGTLDEITVWNRALSAAELQSSRNLLRAGNEPGPLSPTADGRRRGTPPRTSPDSATPANCSVAQWTGSTAYLGDGRCTSGRRPGVPNFFRGCTPSTARAE
jgi:hypothetical protein